MSKVSQVLIRFLETAPVPVQILAKIADYALLLLFFYIGYRVFRHYSHRLPMRSWDNY